MPFFRYSRTSFSVVTLLNRRGRRVVKCRGSLKEWLEGVAGHSLFHAQLLNLWHQDMQQSLDGLERELLLPMEQLGGRGGEGRGGEGRGGEERGVGARPSNAPRHAQTSKVEYQGLTHSAVGVKSVGTCGSTSLALLDATPCVRGRRSAGPNRFPLSSTLRGSVTMVSPGSVLATVLPSATAAGRTSACAMALVGSVLTSTVSKGTSGVGMSGTACLLAPCSLDTPTELRTAPP